MRPLIVVALVFNTLARCSSSDDGIELKPYIGSKPGPELVFRESTPEPHAVDQQLSAGTEPDLGAGAGTVLTEDGEIVESLTNMILQLSSTMSREQLIQKTKSVYGDSVETTVKVLMRDLMPRAPRQPAPSAPVANSERPGPNAPAKRQLQKKEEEKGIIDSVVGFFSDMVAPETNGEYARLPAGVLSEKRTESDDIPLQRKRKHNVQQRRGDQALPEQAPVKSSSAQVIPDDEEAQFLDAVERAIQESVLESVIAASAAEAEAKKETQKSPASVTQGPAVGPEVNADSKGEWESFFSKLRLQPTSTPDSVKLVVAVAISLEGLAGNYGCELGASDPILSVYQHLFRYFKAFGTTRPFLLSTEADKELNVAAPIATLVQEGQAGSRLVKMKAEPTEGGEILDTIKLLAESIPGTTF